MRPQVQVVIEHRVLGAETDGPLSGLGHLDVGNARGGNAHGATLNVSQPQHRVVVDGVGDLRLQVSGGRAGSYFKFEVLHGLHDANANLHTAP